jgi:hypothetical protein
MQAPPRACPWEPKFYSYNPCYSINVSPKGANWEDLLHNSLSAGSIS